jgi:AcrR family transcriptional regulator
VADTAPDAPRRERADAARNRARVLAAAERLFAARDPAQVTMEDIARAAGVGKGTLYRRFPDRASIAEALLDEHERDLQDRLLRGPGPLGPGAPPEARSGAPSGSAPAERLAAFYAAMVDLLERHVHLALGAETGARRFETGAYGFWRAHVRALLAAAGVADRDALADALLGPLAPELYAFQRRRLTPEQITAGLRRLAHAVAG